MRHLLWVIGVAALVPAVILFMNFTNAPLGQGRNYLVGSVICLIVALIFLGTFFFKQFRDEGRQDISITKF